MRPSPPPSPCWSSSPHACGVGGDAFLLLQRRGEVPVALDGSGAVPARLAAAGASDSYEPVPRTGPRTLTVPGAVDLLAHALASHGTIDLDRATAPARAWAREPASPCGPRWRRPWPTPPRCWPPTRCCRGCTSPAGDRSPSTRRCATNASPSPSTRWPPTAPGASTRAPWRRPSRRDSAEAGGYLDLDDLRAHRTMAMTPISTSFAGGEVWELLRPRRKVAPCSRRWRAWPTGMRTTTTP